MTSPEPAAAVTVLVTGGTGMQGGAVARALRHGAIDVTALVRDPDPAHARQLAADGVGLAVGDLEDPATLSTACSGHTTVFSVQPAPFADKDSERRQAAHLITAAREAGVRHLVHTSVSGTGWRPRYPDVDPGAARNYWDSKEDVEAMVRDAGFPAYTIVKPAFFMENFIPPKVGTMFSLLADGELLVASAAGTKVGLISAADFGAVVAAVATDPDRFAGAEIELGADALTFPQMADIIAEVTGHPVTASCRPTADVDARLGRRSWSVNQEWLDAVGYPATPEHAAAHGLDVPTSFRQWAEEHREQLIAATAPR
jgi:uncharacterized protein YbjT (DUF2867 family)